MFNPFCAAFLLAWEAQKEMELRLVRVAWYGAATRHQATISCLAVVIAAVGINIRLCCVIRTMAQLQAQRAVE
ncbi:hypothetical protein OKC48_24790 [Methylorubrum extorquens]|uniref:hypothetical protein n=1 Tax=Methylorubrum extorquens TaxID=408 RepID=UPI0022372DF0|nr:hypothetical protein [Methylorubrum extorquens]UYW26434.1 hypothetical protein OKC48_24790 [Methylorubrum extorquens]